MRSSLPPDLRAALDGEPDADALAEIWHALGEARPGPTAAPDAAWHALRQRLAAPEETPERASDRPPRPGSTGRSRRVRWPVAALAVAVVGVAAWAFLPVTHQASAGETAAVRLPDGSAAVLNSGAVLRYRRGFWSGRAVSLAGEAFFEVEPSEAPFTVTTYNAQVEVLGTAFNVRAWAEDAETSVALVRGRVRVEAGGQAVVLAPGEAAVVAEALRAEPADVGREAAWRTGTLAFEDRPLGSVLDEVERRYAVAVEAAPGAPLGARVSAFYAERPALDVLLGDLGAAAGARFEPTPTGYRVRAASRPAPRPSVSRDAR